MRILLIFALVLTASFARAQQCQITINGGVTIKTTGVGVTQLCGAATSNVLVSISLTPSTASILQGTSASYTATGTFADSSTADVTSLATWSSSNTSIATIGSTSDPQPVTCGVSANGGATITATIGAISGSGTLSCNPPPNISPTTLPNGTVSTAYSATLTASGGVGTYTWTQPSGTLPTGISLASASPTATLSGTPSVAGTYVFAIKVCDSISDCTTLPYTVVISTSASRTPILPQNWVNEQESILGSYTHTITTTWSGNTFNGAPAFTCSDGTVEGPFVSTGIVGWQSLVESLSQCRGLSFTINGGDSFKVIIPHGTLFQLSNAVANTSGAHGFFLAQCGSPNSTPCSGVVDTSTSPIVFDSDIQVPLGTNLDPNNVTMQARIGTYAIKQTGGIVCTSTFCTVTTAVAMATVPAVGDLATIWQPDNRAYAGQYLICNHTTTGCSDPTSSTFMYPWTGASGTTQNGTLWALQAQNTITSMSSASCSSANAQCTVTVNFASSPGLSVNDRIVIAGASPSWFNGTWYVASTGTNSITFFTYTEFIGNISASTPGVLLHKNHILADQVSCCMYTVELTGGSGPLITADPSAHNYAFYNGEFRVQSSTTAETFGFIHIGSWLDNENPQVPPQMQSSGCNSGVAQTNCDQVMHIGFDRDYIHGYDFPVVTNTEAEIRGALRFEGGYLYLTNSYAEGINDTDSDNNVVSTNYGTGPVKVANNYMEGATESIMSGYYGGCLKVNNYNQVMDYEIRRNWITDNPFIIQNAAVTIPGGSTKYLNYIRKNKVEDKAGQRNLYDGNVIEYSAGAAGQQNGMLLSINDQTGSCGYSSQVTDITYSNNVLRHALSGGYQRSRASNSTSPAFSDVSYRLWYHNNLGYDLGDPTKYGRPGWGGSSWSNFGLSTVMQFGSGGFSFPPSSLLKLTSVATASGGNTVYTGTVTNGASNPYVSQPVVVSGFTNAANNGTFTAVSSTASTLTLANASGIAETHAASATMQGCTGTATTVSGITTATLTCPNLTQGSPAQTQAGLGIHAGDWIEVVNCLDTNYDVIATTQTPSLTESFFTFTISYIVPGAAGASTSGCQLNQQYGHARYVTYDHNTMLFDGSITNSFYSNAQMSGGEEYLWTSQPGSYVMRRDTWIQNNLMSYKQTTFGTGPQLMQCAGTSSSNSNGEIHCYDSNSLVWNQNVMSGGGTASKYTEWNAPNGVAGANNGVTPPVTDVFLANGTPGDACTSIASPTSSCFGFTGNYASTNQAPDFAPSPLDYHQFGIVTNSYWAAGQPGQASDSTNKGIDLNALDKALTLGQYVCATSCGSGPYP